MQMHGPGQRRPGPYVSFDPPLPRPSTSPKPERLPMITRNLTVRALSAAAVLAAAVSLFVTALEVRG